MSREDHPSPRSSSFVQEDENEKTKMINDRHDHDMIFSFDERQQQQKQQHPHLPLLEEPDIDDDKCDLGKKESTSDTQLLYHSQQQQQQQSEQLGTLNRQLIMDHETAAGGNIDDASSSLLSSSPSTHSQRSNSSSNKSYYGSLTVPLNDVPLVDDSDDEHRLNQSNHQNYNADSYYGSPTMNNSGCFPHLTSYCGGATGASDSHEYITTDKNNPIDGLIDEEEFNRYQRELFVSKYGDLESSGAGSWGMGYQSSSGSSGSNSPSSSSADMGGGANYYFNLKNASNVFSSNGNFSSSYRVSSSHLSSCYTYSSSEDAVMEHERKQKCFLNKIVNSGGFKLILSWMIWLSSYLIMGFFGGSVAFYHFPRTSAPHPMPLPDFGYDLIPQYCPLIDIPGGHHKENIQSVVLLVFYLWFFVLCWIQPSSSSPKKKNDSSSVSPRVMVQQLLHLNALVFLTRTTTVGMTGMPQPNPRCVDVQHFNVSYREAVAFVMGRGFPPHACGDLLYSGHVACLLCCMVMFHKYPPYFLYTRTKDSSEQQHTLNGRRLPSKVLLRYLSQKEVSALDGRGKEEERVIKVLSLRRTIVYFSILWCLALVGIYFVISCRSHYSVDVVLAFYFVYFLQEWYFRRSGCSSKKLQQEPKNYHSFLQRLQQQSEKQGIQSSNSLQYSMGANTYDNMNDGKIKLFDHEKQDFLHVHTVPATPKLLGSRFIQWMES